ncbi:DUF6541 family protein [Arthrobacter sp. M4]|uniref:DUF6541 family protein n=1 Tax=Arthrobacter sp. M4 TaxID=218160 RepID=UPI001CDD5222|nr:DUF6541 family protein [Arthrobacter sp. M4]MCA4132259.1 hypothetical protein [Arthrobacter sp. M4]
MNWFDMVVPVLLAFALLAVPGGIVSFALGLRGLAAVATAPVLTVTLSAVLAILLPFVSVGWSPWLVVGGGVLCGLLVFAVRRLLARRAATASQQANPDGGHSSLETQPAFSARRVWIAAAYVAGAALILVQLALVFGTPASFSQTFDNVFHLNGIRYILNTGSASSLTMSGMASGDQPPYFYPAAWHGLAAALVLLGGMSLPVAVNALNMGIAAFIWPLGAMLLTRVVAGKRPVAIAAAALLSAAFSSFPILLLDFGVLYPNFLSISMLPATLASVVLLLNPHRMPEVGCLPRRVLPFLLVPGLALAHPNGFMSLLVLTIPVVLQAHVIRFYIRGGRTTNRRAWLRANWGLAIGAVVFLGLWAVIRPPRDAAFWGPTQSPLGAVFEVATNSAMNRPVAITVSVLMLTGLMISLRHIERYWMIGCFLGVALLFLVVSGIPVSAIRSAITGVWYNDSYRLAALLPLVALPFAAAGMDSVAAWTRRTLFNRTPGVDGPRRPLQRALGLVALILASCAGIAALFPPMASAVETANINYTENDGSPLVSTDEQKVLDRLSAIVKADETIAVNPWTGGALAYALADRDTTAKHILTANTKDVDLLNAKLRDASSDPAVCRAAQRTHVKYVLDFGTKEVHGGNHRFPGLEEPQSSDSFSLVLQEGSARLYKLKDCKSS